VRELRPNLTFSVFASPLIDSRGEIRVYGEVLVACDRFNRESRYKEFYEADWVHDEVERLIYSPPSQFPCSLSMAEQFSGQYRKAHFAAFPPDLWPGVVDRGTEAEGGATFLRLKDGTRVQVSPGTR